MILTNAQAKLLVDAGYAIISPNVLSGGFTGRAPATVMVQNSYEKSSDRDVWEMWYSYFQVSGTSDDHAKQAAEVIVFRTGSIPTITGYKERYYLEQAVAPLPPPPPPPPPVPTQVAPPPVQPMSNQPAENTVSNAVADAHTAVTKVWTGNSLPAITGIADPSSLLPASAQSFLSQLTNETTKNDPVRDGQMPQKPNYTPLIILGVAAVLFFLLVRRK
jgi:hypothetical protein